MSPVYKLSANSVKNGRTVYGSMLAGNTAFKPTSFESIATVTVGSGGAASVEFTSIAADWTHLQIRAIARNQTNPDLFMQFNSDTGSNYVRHYLYGDGSSAASGATTSTTSISAGYVHIDTDTANLFAPLVLDILDYANTNKNKTTRSLTGNDKNGSGLIVFYSGLWMNTNAITSIKLFPNQQGGTKIFQQYSHFALYGIKGA